MKRKQCIFIARFIAIHFYSDTAVSQWIHSLGLKPVPPLTCLPAMIYWEKQLIFLVFDIFYLVHKIGIMITCYCEDQAN